MRKISTLMIIALLIIGFVGAFSQVVVASPHIDIDVSTAWNMMTSKLYPNMVILDVRN
jgi:hypothetical protein